MTPPLIVIFILLGLSSASWIDDPLDVKSLWRNLDVEESDFIVDDLNCVLKDILSSWIQTTGVDLEDEEWGPVPEVVATEDGCEDLYCANCRTALGGLKALIRQGLTYEQIKPIAMPVCMAVCDNYNWRGDLICDGILDVYGPHVIYTLNNTDLSANEICVLHRACDAPTAQETSGIHFFPTRREITDTTKKTRRLDDMIKVVHMTDIHVDKEYSTGAATACNMPLCCRDKWNGTGSAGHWGDYRCNVHPRTIHTLMDHLYEEVQPDFAIYTGDNAPSEMWEETLESQLETQNFVTSSFREHMPGVPAYPTVGNHDMYPTNLYYPGVNESLVFNDAYFNMWQDLSDLGEEERDPIMVGAYFQKIIRPGLRLLSFNSNYGFTDNFYGALVMEHESWLEMLDFMEDTFNLARANGEKVLLLSHHPIGNRGRFEYYETAIDDIVGRNGDLVVLHGLGHNHHHSFSVHLHPETGEPMSVWLLTAAAVCSPNNPAARVYYLDPDTYATVDYEDYHIDISTYIDEDVEVEVEMLYRASEEYGIEDVMADSMFDLTERFLTDEDLYYQFKYNQVSRRAEPSPCDASCRYNAVCGMRSHTYAKYRQCVEQAKQLYL